MLNALIYLDKLIKYLFLFKFCIVSLSTSYFIIKIRKKSFFKKNINELKFI